MHPSKVITDPRINDTYYDPDLDKLYQYVKVGDELTIFTDTGLFEIKSQNKNRVKTIMKF